MKKIKVSEATNIQLDWLVAKCEGIGVDDITVLPTGRCVVLGDAYEGVPDVLIPGYTADPAQMWPIIEQLEGLLMKRWLEANREGRCQVEIHNYDGDWIAFGPTLLVAAARCYVMSKLGEDVEVPEGLT